MLRRRIIALPRLLAALGAGLALFAGAAQAGDAAARRIIGFSPDGNYFAFEQYGTLDAGASDSGYSEIDIIDTRTDQFVGGKPILVAARANPGRQQNGDCSASFDETLQGDSALQGDKTGKALGFRLTLEGQDGRPFKLLHEDKSVPGSRNCPTSYSLSESYEFTPDGKPAVIAVLVQRFSQGFEGRDRRFIAVTGQAR